MVKIATLAGALTVGALLLVPATAQFGPLPGLPMTPPPTDHPALAAQPLMRTVDAPRPPVPAQPAAATPAPSQPDPATQGVKCGGRDLAANVKKVKALEWGKSLDRVRAEATASGKPILWLQTLGDLTGFA
ncbi:MAG: hypothetical protein H6835_09420 [Planctomycetes bacterium]|nr:hypothetical protein [Planctomycetota bacterium]